MSKAEELIACLEGEIAKRDARIVELQRYEHAFNEWHDKTEWVQAESATLSAKYLGCHRADVMRSLIDDLRAELAACRVTVENCDLFRARIAELEAHIVWLECEAKVNAAPVSEAKAHGVVQWPNADEIMQMAFEEGQPADDASGYCFELEEFDLFIERLMSEVARLNAAPAQQVSVPDEMRSLAQRLREYNQNPHHINPMSEAFHILVADAANAISTACVPKEIAAAITWSEHLLFECGALTSTRAPSVHVYNKTFAAVNEARAMLAAAPAAPAAYAGLVEVLAELVSAANSVNKGREHEVRGLQDSEPCYWQQKEWVDWLVTLGEQGRSALAAHRAKGVV